MSETVELVSDPSEIKMTIHVTRKETGKVETFELIGTAKKEQVKQIEKDK